jgi:spermidine synthase
MRIALVLACFFLSGAAGLIYEVCWIRAATLLLGSTSYALGAVLAVYFLGLAAGSYVLGRIAQRVRTPLQLFARIELVVGLLAALSLPLLHALTPLYGAIYRATGGQPQAAFLARLAVLSLVLLPPTFLMGGALPLLCRQFVTDASRVARGVGRLYALNTFGAAVGCAVTGLVLVPALGMQSTVLIGVGVSMLCGLAVMGVRLPGPTLPATTAAGAWPATTDPTGARRAPVGLPRDFEPTLVALLFFVTGLVALGQEVLWTRYLALLVRSTFTTATLTLTVVLAGIVLGSLLSAWANDRTAARARRFGLLQALTGLSLLTLMLLPPSAWHALGGQLPTLFVLMLPVAALSGALYPLAVSMVVSDARLAPAGVGRMSAVNTLGGIVGSLAFAFVILPGLGLRSSALLSSGLSVACGVAAWLAIDRSGTWRDRGLLCAAALALWLLLPAVLRTRLPADFLASRDALVDYREGRESNLAVVRREDAQVLEIDHWWQGQDRPTHQIVAAHLPMLLHPDPRRVLVVGVGAGQTPDRFTYYGLQRLVCVDIEPAVFELIREHFDAGWMSDPRVILLREDGRNYLQHAADRYDIVSLELGQVFRPGVAAFYTVELYQSVRNRLEPGGVACQFVPTSFLTPEALCSVIRTFASVFPHCMLWYNTSELLLLGGRDGLPRVDFTALAQRLAQPRIAQDLRYSHWGGAAEQLGRPSALLGSYLCGPAELEAIAAGAPLLRDDRPVLEVTARAADELQARELPIVELLRGHLGSFEQLTLDPLPPDSMAVAASIRAANLGDMVASALLRRVESVRQSGSTPELRALLARALEANPRSVLGLRLMGDALTLSQEFAEARHDYERAIALRPEDARALRGLAVLLHRTGDLTGAVERYRHLLALRPADAELHNNIGVALAQQGDLPAARQHFAEAVRLQPGYDEAARNLAKAQAALGGAQTPRPGAARGE